MLFFAFLLERNSQLANDGSKIRIIMLRLLMYIVDFVLNDVKAVVEHSDSTDQLLLMLQNVGHHFCDQVVLEVFRVELGSLLNTSLVHNRVLSSLQNVLDFVHDVGGCLKGCIIELRSAALMTGFEHSHVGLFEETRYWRSFCKNC